MEKENKGAYQAINVCLGLKEGETAVIFTDTETIEIAISLLQEAKKITDRIHFFIAEDFGERPLRQVPVQVKDVLADTDVFVLAMQGRKGELESFRRPLLNSVPKTKIRMANMINISKDMMMQGMQADYRDIRKFSQNAYDVLEGALQLHVKTESGTDLIAEFSSDISWVIGDGIIKPGEWSNLPDGEVFTCPINVNGKIVVDGIMGEHFAKKYGLLDKAPLSIEIEDGRVVSARSENSALAKDFLERIKEDENASRVGEVGLGTNKYVKKLIGRMVQDEKIPGVHIAFGNGYPEKTGSKQRSKIHLDCVILRPDVYADGKKIMEKGSWSI